MILEFSSQKPLDQIDAALREAAAENRFGVIAVHDLKRTLKEKGVEYDADCMVYEVCNPQQAKRALEAAGAVSSALPCRVSVYGTPGAYTISTIRPSALMQMFPSPELEPVAREVEDALARIMKAAV